MTQASQEAVTHSAPPVNAPRASTSHFERAVSILVAAVLLASALLHLENPYYFLSSIYQYQLTGRWFGFALAAILPFLQLAVSVCLLGRIYVSGALFLSVALFACFSAAQGLAMWRDMNIPCGCFGGSYQRQIGAWTLIPVLILLQLAVVAYVARLSLEGRDRVHKSEESGPRPADLDPV